MNRRGFFKTFLFTPILAPYFISSKKSTNDLDLYLLADTPQKFLPLLLNELGKLGILAGNQYAFLNSHPMERELRKTLSKTGWQNVQEPILSVLSLSFTPLSNHASSSFTLVRNGKILDLRSKKLYSLWIEMQKNYRPSSCLTIASLKSTFFSPRPGEIVSIFNSGREIERISLKEPALKSFRAKNGNITMRIEDKKAWISESSCRHKICLHASPVSLSGERIICAPNNFFLEVQGANSVDTVIG
ncbi:NusG domain II-containing protein [Acidobacteriota bacterium]